MDLLGNYASSDEDEHEEQQPPPSQLIPAAKPAKLDSVSAEEKDEGFFPKSNPRGGIFNSLPPPRLSLFNSLPQPKSQSFSNPKPQPGAEHRVDEEITENMKPKSSSSSSSLFSSLPRPKPASSAAKKVVQFRPPVVANPSSRSLDEDDDDDDDEGEEEKKRKILREKVSTASATSFLSSIPAPKHSATLGALPSASGMGRRSIIETSSQPSNVSTGMDAGANPNVGYSNNQSNDANYANYSDSGTGNDAGSNPDSVNYGGYDNSTSLGSESYAYYAEYAGASTDVGTAGVDAGMNPNVAGSYEGVDYSYPQGNHVDYTNYGGGSGNNLQYENNWGNSTALPEASRVIENALPRKRGRKDIPPEIIEVKQDELMKNRPREDQVKSTGIAFGPTYQPASTKGKPTKLHKRKHQIGALYFDMRQKESELAERRSRGFLTKSQTQGKYGW